MLLFYCADNEERAAIHRKGLTASDGHPARLWTSLAEAQAHCRGLVLVIDAGALPDGAVHAGADGARVRAVVPPEAFCNLHPYRPPEPVAAAGGYVVRPGDAAPEVLLIFRRGVWDLPKGKRDAGETIEACALREVCEELGIAALRLVCPLGTTTHGYAEQGHYCVKTTHWFLMQTPETQFTPEAREGIEAVAWMPWPEAVRRVGYDSLRRHMQHVAEAVEASVVRME